MAKRILSQVVIRTAIFPLFIPCSLEIFKQDDILFGRGTVVVSLEGEDLKSLLTFLPKVRLDDHGNGVRFNIYLMNLGKVCSCSQTTNALWNNLPPDVST